MTCTPRTVQSVNISVPTTPKRPYLRAAARRRQLLDAAGRLFDRSGFGGITMAGAAVEAGVSRQLVYDHWRAALYESLGFTVAFETVGFRALVNLRGRSGTRSSLVR